ncbi:hypothetical protein FCL47_15220 [Desulfopila sp. IMCC35006]|uniref:hypothetical protein n=1 Tax=Desulfopila sp. IMCC35006 TaxID=2569542 RepID=UPI0010AB551A|nr:hypothetical protein [Desulfopila sp. IMCC35006]TKB24999.1 hypothetical protein FCL47_15220 [Desulfopila sp. IMCC35006]
MLENDKVNKDIDRKDIDNSYCLLFKRSSNKTGYLSRENILKEKRGDVLILQVAIKLYVENGSGIGEFRSDNMGFRKTTFPKKDVH